jgi:spore maturation protein CgeB
MLPDAGAARRGDVVWIGNWDDEHRTAELRRLFLEPVTDLGLVAKIHSARCPKAAIAELAERGIEFGGWLPNFRVPYVYAQHTMAVHVPRTPYAGALRGVPTIGVFEALACGIPLIVAMWENTEGIFTAGEDFLAASDPESMRAEMRRLLHDADTRRAVATTGRQRVLARHTCVHRVNELLEIAGLLEMRGIARQTSEEQCA